MGIEIGATDFLPYSLYVIRTRIPWHFILILQKPVEQVVVFDKSIFLSSCKTSLGGGYEETGVEEWL